MPLKGAKNYDKTFGTRLSNWGVMAINQIKGGSRVLDIAKFFNYLTFR